RQPRCRALRRRPRALPARVRGRLVVSPAHEGAEPMKRFLSLAVLSAAATAALAAPEVPFPTAAARFEQAPRERLFDGTIEAVNRATVSAQTTGRVAEILYDVNDFVEADAVIMRFTDVEQRAALRQAIAAHEEAEARFTEADQE